MSLNPCYANQPIIKPSPVKEEELPLRVSTFKKLVPTLFQKPSDLRTSLLRYQMKELNALRTKFPQHETLLTEPVFDLFYQAQIKESEFIAQSIGVALFNNFTNTPPKNVETAKSVCQAIQDCTNAKDYRPMLQRLIKQLAVSYHTLKASDTDLTLAKSIQETALFCLKLRKKTLNDENWMHEVAHTLAEQLPASEFQDFAQQFPAKGPRNTANKEKLPKEALSVYDFKSSGISNKFSVYNRD